VAKFTIDLGDQPKLEWTTRQQRAWIREATREVNKAVYDIQTSGQDLRKDYPLLAEQRDRLIELGTGKEYRGGIGLGLTYKTKAELQLQARALKETLNLLQGEVQTEEQQAQYSQAYDTFIENHPGIDLSYEEYTDMVEVMGAAGEHLLNSFGNSDDFIEAYADAREDGQSHVDVMQAMVEVNREAKGQGLSTNQMLTRLRDYLDI
jgi:hypothetical protein